MSEPMFVAYSIVFLKTIEDADAKMLQNIGNIAGYCQ